MGIRRGRTVALLVVCVLVIAAGFAAGYAISRGVEHVTAEPAPPRPTLPPAVSEATAPPSTPPPAPAGAAAMPAGVRAAIASLTHDQALGPRLLARVADARTGRVLFDGAGSTPAAPASTAKLLTAAAVLEARPSTTRFTTTVEDAGDGTVVLVGGGDPTLAAAAPGKAPTFPGAARLSDLARQLRAAHVTVRRIVVDGSLFTGPAVSPAWEASDIGTSYAAPITALMSDAGIIAPPGYARSTAPDLAAGKALATLLGQPKLPVEQGTAPPGAKPAASVRSAPLAELVDQMLQNSDNVIAEVLARQVALAEHRPASFAGAVAAIRTVLGRLGVQVGTGMKDGSGLAASDRVAPATLVAVLRLIAGAGPAAAVPVRLVASALPVAGWSGTLAERYLDGAEHYAAGRVRAKTGTLSTVSSLAGMVRDRTGRLLVFSFDADRAVGTAGAEAALDRIVTRLARCGCG